MNSNPTIYENLTIKQILFLKLCPSECGYEEQDCWNDDCETCWEKAIKSGKTLDTICEKG